MKTFLIASALVGAVLAQELGTLPSCATGCLTKFTTGGNIGSCGSLNAACICKDSNFLSGIACCLKDTCSQSDQTAAVNYAVQFCGAQGVQVPTAVSCASSGPTATASSSSTGSQSGSSTGTQTSTGTTTAGANTAAPSSTTVKPNAAAIATPGPQLIAGALAALAFL